MGQQSAHKYIISQNLIHAESYIFSNHCFARGGQTFGNYRLLSTHFNVLNDLCTILITMTIFVRVILWFEF